MTPGKVEKLDPDYLNMAEELLQLVGEVVVDQGLDI